MREVLTLYDAHGLGLRVAVDDTLPDIAGDAVKLRQVIHNLVRNAADAVAGVSLPRVHVSLERADGARVALRVSDNGAGFPREFLGRAPEPYMTTKARGTGLGLSIVRKIVEEHGGAMHLENLATGGARVSVLLPPGAAAPAPRRAVPAASEQTT